MKVSIKKNHLFVSFLGILIIAALIFFKNYTVDLFEKRNKIVFLLSDLKSQLIQIHYNILRTSFYLYENYDTFTKFEETIHDRNDKLFALLQHFPLQQQIEEYKKAFQYEEQLITRYQTYNSLIKNSLTYIPKLCEKLLSYHLPYQYEKEVIALLTSTFLAKNSMDKSFITQLKKNLQHLRRFTFHDRTLQRTHQILLAHLSVFIQNYPSFVDIIDKLLQAKAQTKLQLLENSAKKILLEKTQTVELIFLFVALLYTIALGVILYILHKLEIENQELLQLQKVLAIQAKTDALTGLFNRKTFKSDVRKCKHPLFILLNIKGFKHFNELYGMSAGDHILRQCGLLLRNFKKRYYPQALLYRIGADEFGILLDERKGRYEDKKLLAHLFEIFEHHPITYKNITTNLSIHTTLTRKRPLLETADLAMQQLKKDPTLKYLIYKEELGLIQEIKNNIKKSKILKAALEQKRVIPYFQAIYDIKRNRPIKFEALARIRHKDNIESIFPYLEVAKELNLYDTITKTIFDQAIAVAKSKNIVISLNLSMRDIQNPQFRSYLHKRIVEDPSLAPLLSFEILESETLANYDLVADFIKGVKKFRSSVGIDDFGSGYSNFAHIFNLDIDYIKIDGSLIKGIHEDETSRKIVRSITSLAHSLGIKVTAEFVHSKEVLQTLQSIGVDYGQGFFLGEPEPFML